MGRRPGIVAAHSLDHVDFEVPDLAEAERFYRAFGLEVERAAGVLEIRTACDPRPWAFVHQGHGKKKLRQISFGVFADDLPRFAARAASFGIPTMAPLTSRSVEGSLWLRDPHGVAIELAPAEKRTLDARPPVPVEPLRDRAAPLRADTKPVKPLRLSHALFFTPDLSASLAFYRDMIGLRVSDDAGGVAFMHAPHGSDHHIVAFAKSSGTGLHHFAWAVDSLEAVGLGGMQMAEAGFTRGWGLGRHVLGSNYFQYVRDPWGSYSEYSFDIDYVPAGLDWPASQQLPENGLYLWGPTPPSDFTTNFEVDGSPARHS